MMRPKNKNFENLLDGSKKVLPRCLTKSRGVEINSWAVSTENRGRWFFKMHIAGRKFSWSSGDYCNYIIIFYLSTVDLESTSHRHRATTAAKGKTGLISAMNKYY